MHFPVVLLRRSSTVRLIFRHLASDTRMRGEVFTKIAASPKLQCQILRMMANHPQAQRNLLVELAKTTRLCRKIMKLAGRLI